MPRKMIFRGMIWFAWTLAVALASGKGANWKYGETGYGTDDWSKVSPHCSESAQSPINIDRTTVRTNPSLKGLSFTSDNKDGSVSGKLVNNGHAPTLKIIKSRGTATLTGGPLGNSLYKLEQLHFHFGCENNKGSEHIINGHAYSGEIHFVTYNTKYGSFSQAMDKPDGLSVIGVFFETEQESNEDLDEDEPNMFVPQLFGKMWKVKLPGSETSVSSMPLFKLVPLLADLSKASFYSYKGSLTTPPCYQSVNWIVMKSPVHASKYCMTALRHLRDHEEHSICNNFRPVQPLNDRPVSVYSD